MLEDSNPLVFLPYLIPLWCGVTGKEGFTTPNKARSNIIIKVQGVGVAQDWGESVRAKRF